jgi:hypothetical protein
VNCRISVVNAGRAGEVSRGSLEPAVDGALGDLAQRDEDADQDERCDNDRRIRSLAGDGDERRLDGA